MNANWLVPMIFAAMGLLGAWVLAQYFAGVPMDGLGPVYGFWLTMSGFLLAGVAVRELQRRRSEELRSAASRRLSGERESSERQI
jgi:hypothetical protein